MGDAVCEVIEAMFERLCDLEEADPFLYLVQKEQLAAVYTLFCTDPALTIEKIREVVEGGEV